MPKWKQKAFEDLPAFRHELQQNCETPYLFFGFLHDEMKKALRAGEFAVAEQILEYVKWCITSAPRGTDADNDVLTMVMCGFVEHIPDDEDSYSWVAKKWPRWLMLDLREVLTYHGGEEQYRRCALQDA